MNELNEKLIDIIEQWDPLGYGQHAYETEVVDVIQALHEIDDPRLLAKRIQFIYEFSFEEVVSIKECQELAKKILNIKNRISCIN